MARDAKGFSLIELILSVTIVAVLVGVVVNLIISTSESQKYAERLSRANLVNQDLLNAMREELASSVALFQNDSLGSAYLGLLEIDPQAPILPGTALPTMDGSEVFALEAAARTRTGNGLLFAQHGWTTEFTCTSTNTYRVDVYRVLLYYLSEEDGGPQPDSSIGLNLCKFVSEPLADGGQVDRITDPTDQQEVLAHLLDATADDLGITHPPVSVVWLRKEDPAVAGTLRQIDPATYALSDSPISPRGPSWSLVRDAAHSSDGMLYYRYFSVASNYSPAAWQVARFGQIDNTGSGFPHGFEAQIVGPSAGRLVLLHLTITTTNNHGERAHSDMRTQVYVPDV